MGIFLALLAGVLWGFLSIFVKSLQAVGFSSLDCVGIRASFSVIILFFLILIKDKKLLKIEKKDIIYLVLLGVFYIMFAFFYFLDMQIIGGASIPALLLETAPVFVIIFSRILFKQKLSIKQIICLALILLGLMFITGVFSGKELLSIKGLAVGIASAVGYALYSITNKKVADKYNALTITFYCFLTASILLLPFTKVIPNIDKLVKLDSLLNGLGLSIVCSIIPFIAYSESIKKANINTVSILATIDLPTATAVGIIFFEETLSTSTVIGFVIVLAAIITLNIKGNKKEI